MRVCRCVARLLAAWGNASIFSPASLVEVHAQKAGIYLELAELQPARQASKNCSKSLVSEKVKARFRSLAFFEGAEVRIMAIFH